MGTFERYLAANYGCATRELLFLNIFRYFKMSNFNKLKILINYNIIYEITKDDIFSYFS